MAQEENSCSGGGGGGGPPGGRGGGGGGGCGRTKKIKQKKVPQRGLGVAQLEKIRIEEQQKRESLQAANVFARNAVDSSPYLDKIRPHFRNEIMQENCVHKGEVDTKAILNPKLWGGDYHHGLTLDPNLKFSIENLPVVSQRLSQFHQPSASSSSSSMLQVNSSCGIQQLSVVSSQMEPPSNQNQSFRSNNFAPLWTEEDKIVGLKRSYPFSLESPPAPSFSFRPIYAASSSKSDELALCSNGYTDRMDPKSKCIRGSSSPSLSQICRGGPSNSSPLPEKKPNEATRDDGRLNGDFLTLAPPSVASPPLIAKHILGYSGYQGQVSYDDFANSQMHQPGPSEPFEQAFSFFPVKNQTSSDASNGNGEKGETIDLNLKL